MSNEQNLPSSIRGSWSFDDLAWIWSIYRRRWLLVAICLVLTMGVTAVAIVIKGVRYEVTAALYYKFGAEMVPPPLVDKESVMVTRRPEDVNTEIEILRSPDLVRQVVQGLGEDFFRDPPPETYFGHLKVQAKKAVDLVRQSVQEILIQARMRRRLTRLEQAELAIQSALRVEPVRNADAVNVSLQVSDPQGGELILAKILDVYLQRHQSVHRNPGMREFFNVQRDKLKNDLDRSAADLLHFQKEHRLWSADQQRTLLLDRHRLLQQQSSGTALRLAMLEAEIKELNMALSQIPPSLELSRTEQRNPAIDDTEESLAALDLALASLTTSFREGTRELDDKTKQINFLRERKARLSPMIPYATTTGISQIFQDLTKERNLKAAEVQGLKNMMAVEERQLTVLENQLPELESSTLRFHEMQREHQSLEKNYGLYVDSLEKSRITEVMNEAQISNVSIIGPPTASLLPVWPSLKLVIAAAVAVGLGIGSALAFLLEMRRAARLRRA